MGAAVKKFTFVTPFVHALLQSYFRSAIKLGELPAM